MRQAGRYLPEFRSIREKNQDFIKLCLNTKLSSEITIQPITRFDFDAAIIFSDILLVPYALGQQVKFKKNFGDKFYIEIQRHNDLNEDVFEKFNLDQSKKLEIPIICIVDSNTDPSLCDFPIPASDDSIRTIQLIINEIANSIISISKKDDDKVSTSEKKDQMDS